MSLTSRRIGNGWMNYNSVMAAVEDGETVGGIAVGIVVKVIRGIKVPIGTVGTVIKSWGDDYGSLTIKTKDGRTYRTYERNVEIGD